MLFWRGVRGVGRFLAISEKAKEEGSRQDAGGTKQGCALEMQACMGE
jgi:hypothetical protein